MKRLLLAVVAIIGFLSVRAVDLAGQNLTVTTLDSAGYSNSGAAATLTIDLADDVVYAGVVGANVKVVKRGAGTLTLSSQWSSCPALTVESGCVAAPNPTYLCVAKGPLTLDGGTVRFTSSYNWATASVPVLTVKFNSEGTIDLPAGVTHLFANWQDFIRYPHATLHLTGAGIGYLSGRANADQCRDGLLDARCGTLRHGNQVFGAADGDTVRTTMRLNEGVTADVLESRFMTWPKCAILQGATVIATTQAQNYTNTIGRVAKTYEGLTFGERVTVEPSATPSRICVYTAALATKSTETVFDVKTGATLEIYSRLARGRASASVSRTGQGFVKTGGGTLKIFEAMDVDGLVHVIEGTLVLSRAAYLSCAAQIKCEPGATVRLADGAQLVTVVRPGVTRDPFLSTAKVWVDATQLPYADGQSVPVVPNLGLAGGQFRQFTKGTNNVPFSPVLQTNGINGKHSILFQGNQGLVLDTYTNKSYKIHVFVAYKPTDVTSSYRTSFPLTLCCANGGTACGQQTDNGTAGIMNGHVVFAPQSDWRNIMADHGAKRYTIDWTTNGVAQDAAIVLEHLRDGIYTAQSIGGKVFYGAEGVWPASGFQTSGGYSVAQDIEQVALGCRLLTDGSAKEGSSRFYGFVGEVLVFDEYLAGDQRAYVENYLRNKWLGASQTLPTLSGFTACAVTNLVVDVPAGRAAFAPGASGTAPTVANTVVKTGAGELTYAGASPDLTKFVVAEGPVGFADANGGSAAAVWIDAADEATVTTQTGADGVTRVVRLANKGAAGGAFAQNPHIDAANGVTSPAACPAYVTGTDGLNGRGALAFDWFSALSTEAYTNRNADTCGLCVYCVCVRTDFRTGTAAGPFCFTILDTDKSDVNCEHYLLWQDTTATKKTFFLGNGWVKGSFYRENCADTGTPLLFVFQAGAASLGLAEYVSDGSSLVPTTVWSSINDGTTHYSAPTLDFIQLGGRVRGHGAPFCPTDKSFSLNRMWKGKIGEFIVFDHRPSQPEETELCAYLAKKWFNLGSGSSEPPAFLAGRAAAPSFRAGTELALADGTAVRLTTTNVVAVGTLTAPGAVSVRAPKVEKAAWQPLFTFASFAGDLSQWTLVGSRRTLRRQGQTIGSQAPGMVILVR